MTTGELGGRLLASVSRSFYLSIRLLPGPLREPIGLAYLLARASDTIADSTAAPAEVRLGHLKAFAEMVRNLSTAGLSELQKDIQPPDPSERELVAQLEPAIAWLRSLNAETRAEIQKVLELIIHGQALDVERFPDANAADVRALPSAVELEEYTYLVAGCVGEFWTRVCFMKLPDYSRMAPAELSRLGGEFGKALQFVNILRDLPADLRAGRCYLPEDELRAIGIAPAALLAKGKEAAPVFERWRSRAEVLLASGHSYIAAIRPFRARAACYLPWRLGQATLSLLRVSPPLETPHRVKVRRSFVYAALVRAMGVGLSNAALPASGKESGMR